MWIFESCNNQRINTSRAYLFKRNSVHVNELAKILKFPKTIFQYVQLHNTRNLGREKIQDESV